MSNSMIGSFGNLASAATVAASSFEMKITNPQPFVDQIEPSRWEQMKGRGSLRSVPGPSPKYVEPPVATATEEIPEPSGPPREQEELAVEQLSASEDNVARETGSSQSKEDIHGKVYRLEDFIDTDAVIKNQFLILSSSKKKKKKSGEGLSNVEFIARTGSISPHREDK